MTPERERLMEALVVERRHGGTHPVKAARAIDPSGRDEWR